MSDYITFDAQITPMVWGETTYTILPLPHDVLDQLDGTKRVEGEFKDHPVNLAISRAPVHEGAFLWTGKSLLDRIGLAPGEEFEARLRPVADDVVDVANDVLRALRSGGASEAWDALSPGQKRRHLYGIDTAKRAETRAKRITKLVTELTA